MMMQKYAPYAARNHITRTIAVGERAATRSMNPFPIVEKMSWSMLIAAAKVRTNTC